MSGSGRLTLSQPQPELEDILDLGLKELYQRLKDPARAKALPGTGLVNMMNNIVRILEKREERGENEHKEETDVLDLIESLELPDEKKLALIQAEIAKTDLRRQKLLDALEGMSYERSQHV